MGQRLSGFELYTNCFANLSQKEQTDYFTVKALPINLSLIYSIMETLDSCLSIKMLDINYFKLTYHSENE